MIFFLISCSFRGYLDGLLVWGWLLLLLHYWSPSWKAGKDLSVYSLLIFAFYYLHNKKNFIFRKRGRRLKDLKFKRWEYLKGILVERFSFDSMWSSQWKSWRSWRALIIKAGLSNDWDSLACAHPTGAGCGDATEPGYPRKLTRGASVTLRLTMKRRGGSRLARGASRSRIPVIALLCFVL